MHFSRLCGTRHFGEHQRYKTCLDASFPCKPLCRISVVIVKQDSMLPQFKVRQIIYKSQECFALYVPILVRNTSGLGYTDTVRRVWR